MPETLTQIALSQKGSLVTHENGKSPGVAGSQVTVKTRSLSISQLYFPLCHLYFNIPFSPGGFFSQEISTSSEPPMERENLLPNDFHKSLGVNLTLGTVPILKKDLVATKGMLSLELGVVSSPHETYETQIWVRDSPEGILGALNRWRKYGYWAGRN